MKKRKRKTSSSSQTKYDDNDDDNIPKQSKGRGAKRSGTARSDHLAWLQKREARNAKIEQRVRMKFKHLQKKISCETASQERAILYCDLAHLHRKLGKS